MSAANAPPASSAPGIRRREDPRLLTGTARYTDDITLPGMVHAAILRSPHGHARITRDRHERARRARPASSRVYTGRRHGQGALKPIPCAWLLPEQQSEDRAPTAALAKDVVRYVGDAVAVVVAETPHTRRTTRSS